MNIPEKGEYVSLQTRKSGCCLLVAEDRSKGLESVGSFLVWFVLGFGAGTGGGRFLLAVRTSL